MKQILQYESALNVIIKDIFLKKMTFLRKFDFFLGNHLKYFGLCDPFFPFARSVHGLH